MVVVVVEIVVATTLVSLSKKLASLFSLYYERIFILMFQSSRFVFISLFEV